LNDNVKQGDVWLSTEAPRILASQAYAAKGVLFIIWDEAVKPAMAYRDDRTVAGGEGRWVLQPHSVHARFDAADGRGNLRRDPLLGGAANATDLSDLFVSLP